MLSQTECKTQNCKKLQACHQHLFSELNGISVGEDRTCETAMCEGTTSVLWLKKCLIEQEYKGKHNIV